MAHGRHGRKGCQWRKRKSIQVAEDRKSFAGSDGAGGTGGDPRPHVRISLAARADGRTATGAPVRLSIPWMTA